MADNIIGTIEPFGGAKTYGDLSQGGLVNFISNLVSLIILVAGIFTLVNFVLAGYGYLSSNGQPQKISAAGNKMLESLIGLIIIAATFIIAGLIGFVVFGDQSALIKLNLFKVLNLPYYSFG